MVEAMYDRSPGYFRQFQIKFRFFISHEKPDSTIAKIYALCTHLDNEYCRVLLTNHYHVLFDLTDALKDFIKQSKFYTVPCLYTTFSCLFANNRTLETTGEVFEKLKLAVECDSSTDQLKRDLEQVYKLLPNAVNSNNSQIFVGNTTCKTLVNNQQTSEIHLQNDHLPNETLKRF